MPHPSTSSAGTQRPLKPRVSAVLVVQLALCLGTWLALLAFWDSSEQPSPDALGALTLLNAAWMLLSWRRLVGRWWDGYVAFMASVTLFNASHPILAAVGLLSTGVMESAFSVGTTARTSLLVLGALVGMHTGALLAASRAQKSAGWIAGTTNNALGPLRQIGILLLILTGPAAIAKNLESIQIVVSSGYFGLYQQDAQVGLGNWQSVLASLFAPSLLINFVAHRHSAAWRRAIWSAAALSFLGNTFLGLRGNAFVGLVPLLMLQHELVARIRPRAIGALAAVGLLLVPWIGSIRTLNLQDRIDAKSGGTFSLLTGVEEMGGSMRTVAHTIELVPALRPFDWGRGYILAATTIVPNLFWDLHPAVAAGNYSTWLIREVDPVQHHAGGGIGFSAIAEAYANGGEMGTLLIMLLLGAAIAHVAMRARTSEGAAGYALEAIVVAAILPFARGESSMIVRPIVWCGILPLLVARVTGEVLAKRRGLQHRGQGRDA